MKERERKMKKREVRVRLGKRDTQINRWKEREIV
jgi:hypothetical protein